MKSTNFNSTNFSKNSSSFFSTNLPKIRRVEFVDFIFVDFIIRRPWVNNRKLTSLPCGWAPSRLRRAGHIHKALYGVFGLFIDLIVTVPALSFEAKTNCDCVEAVLCDIIAHSPAAKMTFVFYLEPSRQLEQTETRH